MKVLITGITGTLGRLVARQLLARGDGVVGVDRRPWPDAPRGITVVEADIRKRAAEEAFRHERPDAVIHLATVTHFNVAKEERYRINLGGTRAVFDYCHAHEVRQVLFVGRHTVYGAAADAPMYHTEEDPPLAASTFPDLADLVAADLYAGSELWRRPEVTTAVLRIVYTLGPSGSGPLMKYLRGPNAAMILGFDPLFQFIHEEDAARAIVAALDHRLRGVFNVAGPPPVPLSLLIKVTGRRAVSVPEFLFPYLPGHLGVPPLPSYAVSHVKYPIVVKDTPFRSATGFAPELDEIQTMESFRYA